MKVEGLTKSFGKQLIWGDVSLVLPRGEICVMLGPSGSGTSVSLEVLVRLLKPDKGHVDTDGYAERFLATFPENVHERLVQRQVVVETTVSAAAPMDCGTACEPDEAQILLFIDKLTTTAGGEQELVHHRVVLSVQREGDTWLVDDIASY